MNRKNLFCRSLARWLVDSPWSYAALLTTSINVIESLPDDIDKVINRVLTQFRSPPVVDVLELFLRDDVSIQAWFLWQKNTPRVSSWNLIESATGPSLTSGLPQIGNETELADWLGLTRGQLIWLTDRFRPSKNRPLELLNYHYSAVGKRRGGYRLIESPKSLLKDVQRQIHSEILKFASTDQSAQGFRRGGSCIRHAQNHVNKRYLFTFDLKDFFPSVGWYQVYGVFARMGYRKDVARNLTGLCTHRVLDRSHLPTALDEDQVRLAHVAHLPQGAPTSPALSNAVCLNLDQRLSGLAISLGLNYSRYADDLSFSGDQHRDWRFLEPLVGSICLEEGFDLNYRKSRQLNQHQRQKVTGIVVNHKANIDRRYYDQLKAILHNSIRHGLASQNRDNHENFYAHLCGRVNHVYQLNQTKGRKLKLLLSKLAS